MYASSDHIYTISHVFNAPCAHVWQTWTDEKHLQHWFEPQGISVTISRFELRQEGELLYHLKIDDDRETWGKWTYVEIIPEEKLVAIISSADEDGNTVPMPWKETWPLELISIIEFREQGERTLVTVEWSPYHADEKECAAFDSSHTEMTLIWRSRFDKLDAYLEQIGYATN